MTGHTEEVIYGDEMARVISEQLKIPMDRLGGFLVLATELNEDHTSFRLITGSNFEGEWPQLMIMREYLKQLGISVDIYTEDGILYDGDDA